MKVMEVLELVELELVELVAGNKCSRRYFQKAFGNLRHKYTRYLGTPKVSRNNLVAGSVQEV